MKPEEVKVGQVWIDNDKRNPGRRLLVLEVSEWGREPYALCENIASKKQAWIKVSRMRPTTTGYRLEREEGDARPGRD